MAVYPLSFRLTPTEGGFWKYTMDIQILINSRSMRLSRSLALDNNSCPWFLAVLSRSGRFATIRHHLVPSLRSALAMIRVHVAVEPQSPS